jgi:CelD/BcsL family acetyltransferase involved in cellulose biosynthesis
MEPSVSNLAVDLQRPAASPAVEAGLDGRLTIEVRPDLDLPRADADKLESLIAERPRVGVFVSKAWLSGLFAEPPDGVIPSLLLIRDGAVLRGIAPIGICQTRTHTCVHMLGGAHGSDRVDLLTARGFEAACSDALLAWAAASFGSKGFVLELRDVPDDSAIWGAVQRAGFERTLRLALQPREIHTLPYLPLAGPDGDHAIDAWPLARRRSLEKHRRMLERRGRLRIDLLQDRGDVATAFEALAGFLHTRWNGHSERSALDNPRMLRFHHRALPLLLSEGRLRMIRVSSDIRTIAVFYGIATGSWWGYFLAGYDRAWAGRIHLGQITLAAAMELATREGAVEFDFLKGAERIKYLWPVRERATIDADIYSHHAGPQLHRAVRTTRDATAALVKSARSILGA